MQQKSLKINATFTFVKAFMNLAFPLISFPYASHILLPEGIGKVNFANSVIEYFVLFANLGIFSYATREATKVHDDKIKLNKTCREIFSIQLISTAFSYLLLFLSFIFIPKFNDYRILLIVSSTKILFTTLGMDWIYNAFEEYKYITIRSIIFQISSLILLFTFVKTPDDYIFYALMGVFSSVGANICNIFYSFKFVNFFEKTKIELKKHIKPILIFFGNSCAVKLHTALDFVMVGFMMNDISVGYYSAANKINTLITGLITTVTYTLMPRCSYYFEKNKIEEYKNLIRKSVNLSLFFSIPSSIGIILICKPLIILFSGKEFLNAIPTMFALTPIIIITSFSTILNHVILFPARKEKYTLQSQIIGCILNIILNLIFIPIWGILGAAIGTLIVETVIAIYLLIFSFKSLKNCKILKNSLQSFLACIIMFFTISLMHYFIKNDIIFLFSSISTGSFLYYLCMLIQKNEIALMILNIIKKRFIKNK